MRSGNKGTPGRMKAWGRAAAGAFLGLTLAVLPVLGQDQPAGQAATQRTAVYVGLPSENTALMLSALGTFAAVASIWAPAAGRDWLFLGTLTIGPSLGFFYGGCWGRGLVSAGLRFGGTVAVVAVALANDEEDLSALGLAWVGAMAVSAVYDIATVKKAVRRQNARRMARRGVQVGVSPFALSKGGGVSVSLSF